MNGFDTHFLVDDVDDILDGAASVQDDVTGDVNVPDDFNGDVSIQYDVNGNVSVNNSDDGRNMDNKIEDIIVISSDDDDDANVSMGDGTVDVSNSRTLIEALALTFYRTRCYVNDAVVSSSISMERQDYMYQ